MKLNLIYHFQASQNQEGEFRPAKYRVVYFFSEEGFLPSAQLQELSKTVPEADHFHLTFLSLDDIKAFALRVAQEFDSPEVKLLSVQDYNIGLDGARDLASFQAIFDKYGEAVVNQEGRKSKGFLGNFFRKS